MTLRPTGRALAGAALRWAVAVVPGGLLIYAGVSGRVVQPALFGSLLVALGMFAFANAAGSYLRVEAGALTGRSLLGRVEIQVDEIARVVPINLSYRRALLMPWKRTARMFEVCTAKGPTDLWLSPYLYGEAPIDALLRHMHIEPETSVQDRVIDVFSRNRGSATRRSR